MTYGEALEYIHSTLRFGMKPGLLRIRTLCGMMNNPQSVLKFVHIAGTNGKGSTAAMTASALQHAGYKTGLYVSPYVIDFRERMSVNGQYISPELLTELTAYIQPLAEKMRLLGESPTEFEIITAMAFEYFRREQCDVVVLEVGMGGRYDATNIITKSLCSVIAKISLDHIDFLGDNLSQIAYEKCGILKKGGLLVTYPFQEKQAMEVICTRAVEEYNQLIVPDADYLDIKENTLYGLHLTYKALDIHVPLAGTHQAANCMTAVETLFALRDVRGMHISDEDITEGISVVHWPARMEVLQEHPLVVIDGGHNLDGVEALCKSLDTFLLGRRVHIIMGMFRDKDYVRCVHLLAERCHSFSAVTADSPRALPSDKLAELARPYCGKVNSYDWDYERAVNDNLRWAGDNSIILICGSLSIAGRMREIVESKKKAEE